MGLRVTDARGRRLRGVALGRALIASIFPIGLLWCAIDRRNRALHDLLTRSTVVYDWLPRRSTEHADAQRPLGEAERTPAMTGELAVPASSSRSGPELWPPVSVVASASSGTVVVRSVSVPVTRRACRNPRIARIPSSTPARTDASPAHRVIVPMVHHP